MNDKRRVVAEGDERSVVMNGSRSEQVFTKGDWLTTKVRDAGGAKSGVTYKNDKEQDRGRSR